MCCHANRSMATPCHATKHGKHCFGLPQENPCLAAMRSFCLLGSAEGWSWLGMHACNALRSSFELHHMLLQCCSACYLAS